MARPRVLAQPFASVYEELTALSIIEICKSSFCLSPYNQSIKQFQIECLALFTPLVKLNYYNMLS